MDEINEQTENMKQIQEALSTPLGSAADFDEVCIILVLFFYLYDFFFNCIYSVSCCADFETIFSVAG